MSDDLDRERRAEDRSTRDTAVRADSKIDQHMQDCIKWREVVQNSFSDLRNDMKSLGTKVTLIIGGLIALSKALDLVTPFIHR